MAGLGWPCTNLRLLTCFIGSLEMPLAELLPIIASGYIVLNSPITQEDTGTASLSSDPRSWSSRFPSPPRFGPERLCGGGRELQHRHLTSLFPLPSPLYAGSEKAAVPSSCVTGAALTLCFLLEATCIWTLL